MGLIRNTEYGDNILVLRLGDELGKNTNVVERPLSIRETHGTIEHVDGAETSRVIPAVLAARKSMKVEVDTDAVLARPLDRLEEVGPTRLGQEWLVVADLNSPVR